MGLFGGGEKQIRKEISKVLGFVEMFIFDRFETDNLAKDLKFERPDSQFRFHIFCLAAVLISVAPKLRDADVVALNACHWATDFCLKDPVRYFGGNVDPETVDRQGIELHAHFIERLNTIGMSFGSLEKLDEVASGFCELVHEVESPEPINQADYERLTEFAAKLYAFMIATAGAF